MDSEKGSTGSFTSLRDGSSAGSSTDGVHKVQGESGTASLANPDNGMSFKGSVSGLRGFLSQKITGGLQSVASTLEKAKSLTRSSEGGTEAIPIEFIYPCPDQPRQVFEPKALEELSQTMRELGQAQAITVRKTQKGYEIISGERRYRAAKLAGLSQLDCVVKDCTAEEGRLLALVENLQRQDLLPLEEALFLKRVLSENKDMSLEKLAKFLGSHKSTLSEKIQLTEIDEELQPLLYSRGRNFTHRHWRVLSRISDKGQLRVMLMQAIDHHLSVAELERSLTAMGIKKADRRKKDKQNQSDMQVSFDFIQRDGDRFRIKAVSFEPSKLSSDNRDKIISELESLVASLKNA